MLEWVHELNGALSVDNMSFCGLSWNSLGADLLALLLGFDLLGIVGSHSSLEGLSALTLSDVLNSDMDSLGEDLSSDLFVDDHTHGGLVHVKNLTSLSVVELMGHALVNAAISNDINKVTLSVSL